MSQSQLVRAFLGLGAGVAMFASAVQAQPEDKRTFFTFSRPITVPGVTLPAGRYIFRIVDTTSSRKVIQVVSDDGKKPYAMLNTITETRREPAKDAEVSFFETSKGTPSTVKSWWYPGERDGYEFIYPKAQARRIARATGATVLTTKAETTKAEDTTSGDLERLDANGRDQDLNAPQALNSPTGSVASTEGPNRTPPQATPPTPAPDSSSSARNQVPTTAPRVARNRLPGTASDLPLAGFIGLLSAAGFATVRLSRKALG